MVKLDMKDEAKAVLQQLLERYPKSDAARGAKERLQALSSPPKKKQPAAKSRKQP